MVARAEIKRGNVYTLRGRSVEVLSEPNREAFLFVKDEDGAIARALPHELRRVAARRVTLKDIAKAYGGKDAVKRLEELRRAR